MATTDEAMAQTTVGEIVDDALDEITARAGEGAPALMEEIEPALRAGALVAIEETAFAVRLGKDARSTAGDLVDAVNLERERG